ncbi:MAG TPA: choice-of-anchor tandem repeat GloVer-containing protein [Terracidiphilus sp.]
MLLIRIAAAACAVALPASLAAQRYQSLHSFTLHSPNSPGRSIAQSRGGYLFTTTEDWNNQLGSAIRVTTGGQVKTVYHFTGSSRIIPRGGLTMGSDGHFYGTTQWGGANGFGSIFRLTNSGAFSALYSFTGGEDGAYPTDAPIESAEGDFYGVTEGNNNQGSIFRISTAGKFEVLHSFPAGGNDFPTGPLVQATNFWFYGTTCSGGANGAGSVFRIDHNGNYSVIHSFNSTDGACPQFGVIQAADGDIYGVTLQGGSTNSGVLFRMNTQGGSFSVLHEFTGAADGANPCTLVEASDGNIWGNTVTGGAYNYGALFRITPLGTFAKVYDYDSGNGFNGEYAHLVQHTNGVFYSDTSSGGPQNGGVFYSYDAGLSPFVTWEPTYGRVGETVKILGQGFTAGSVASFNGVPATTMVVYSTYLTAVVPSGATSGYITVNTATGTLKSNKVFLVRP